MAKTDFEVIKARIADRYDVEYIVDVLRLTPEEVLNAFEERLNERLDDFSEVEDLD